MVNRSEGLFEVLKTLQTQNGVLTAQSVVDAARDPAHPLHDQFDWDDAKAGEKHRLNQARQLIRSVRLVVHEASIIVRAPAYIRDPAADRSEQGYITISKLRGEPARAAEAVLTECERAKAALRRARDVAAVLDLSAECEAMLVHLEALTSRVIALKTA